MPIDPSIALQVNPIVPSQAFNAAKDRARQQKIEDEQLAFQRKQQAFQERQQALQEHAQKLSAVAPIFEAIDPSDPQAAEKYQYAYPKLVEAGFGPEEGITPNWNPAAFDYNRKRFVKGMNEYQKATLAHQKELLAWQKQNQGMDKSLNKEELALRAAQGDRDAALAIGLMNPPKEESAKAPDTITTAEGVMQWDAKTQSWKKVGDRPPSQVAPRDERLVQVMGPQGTPIWVKESDAVGKPAAQAARAVTGAERQTLAFFNRAKGAVDTIATPDSTGTSPEDRVAKSGLVKQLGLKMPNLLQGDEAQAYTQAQRTFTEARLRKESGAAIPPHEYINDSKTYFGQPGDSPKTIEQKRVARNKVLDGLKFASGKAYEEYYGEPSGFGIQQARKPAGNQPSSRPAAATHIATGSDGKEHYLDAAGNDLGVVK